MVQTYDVLTSSSLGTGTTKTQVNAATDYFIPGKINAIHGLIPYHASTAATTAAQTYKPIMFLESEDISPNISPKVYPLPGEAGGLGTTTTGFIPALDLIPTNIACSPGQKIKGYGQYLTANTVAGRLGIGMKLSRFGTGGKTQVFYQVGGSPTGTALGTAAASVDFSDITITDARAAVLAATRIYPTTITASEDYIGYARFSSSNWEPEPLRYPYQPIGSALGALIAVGDLSNSLQKLEVLRTFNSRAQVIVSNGVVVEEALTGNGTGINCIGFIR